MPSTLPTSYEYDISLVCSDIITLQKEEFVDTIILQSCNLDDRSNGAGEALLDHEVLLALDLDKHDMAGQ